MRKRFLHCHSTFSAGGKEARAVRLMNAFGNEAEHVILTAVPGAIEASSAIDPSIRVEFPEDAPSLAGRPSIGRYRLLARYMSAFDLILTYNWGAMDAVMARRIFSEGLPPLIHHEDGFNADEAVRLKTKRNLFRRAALPAASAVVVPSVSLQTIARDVWKQPLGRIQQIQNGIDVSAYGSPTCAIPGFDRQPGELVIGTLAGLRAVKNLTRLVRASAKIPNIRLVIIGEGPERERIVAEAARTGLGDRLVMPGHLPRPSTYIGHFDIFALSSDSEQFPISLVEAMAAGLPCVATDVGDVLTMVSDENRSLIVSRADEPALATALAALCSDPARRRLIGEANRTKALAEYDEGAMIARYRTLYRRTLGDC